MKLIFSNIISQNQSAFIKDKQVTNTIIISPKVLRFLRIGKSKFHHLALKIDLSKVYDKVEWPMVIFMMKSAGFNEKWRG